VSQPGRLLLGLDGGASKTAGVIITDRGEIAARERAGGSAVIGAPGPESCAVLSSLVASLLSSAGVSRSDIAAWGVGLNGVDFEDELPLQRARIASALDASERTLTLVNDAIAALWGASPRPAATILHYGSGFTAAYRAGHGREHLFDHLHVARTFDMRSELIALVARMLNGMAEPTPLLDRALAHFQVTADAYCEAMFRHRIPQHLRLSTPPLIYRSWLEGDPAAARLVELAADDYALTTKAMVAAIGQADADATFGGGVIATAPPEFWPLLTERVHRLCPQVLVKPPDLPADVGAALMAAHRVGVSPSTLFPTLLDEDAARPPCTPTQEPRT
jgi:N-acetylglucosamine kinase-like BadF-type ATPase